MDRTVVAGRTAYMSGADVGPVAAIVPVFNPDAGLAARIQQLSQQVDLVVVVDDGSRGSRPWEVALRGLDKITLVRQPNRGIAAAMNYGIGLAVRWCPDLAFALTVDQDSSLHGDYRERAVRAFLRAKSSGVPVGVICAEQFNESLVTARRRFGAFRSTLEVAQSGLLIPISTIRQFGNFDETLFIDCVDTEYTLRLLAASVFTIVGDGCALRHQVGVTLEVCVFGRPVLFRGKVLKFSYHSALRRYYIARNRLAIYRKYFWCDPLWNLREIVVELAATTLAVLFGPAKCTQALAALLGVLDGLRGRSGKASPAREAALIRGG